MTTTEACDAIIAAGCGWRAPGGKVALAADSTPGYCNLTYCQTLAAAATAHGATAEDLGDAVLAFVNGDPSLLESIL